MREYQIQLEYLKKKCSNHDEQILMPKPSEYRHELNHASHKDIVGCQRHWPTFAVGQE